MPALVKRAARLAVCMALLTASAAQAQAPAQAPTLYGPAIGVEAARKAASAAIAEAKKNAWTVAAAVVDTGGHLVYFERIDGTQVGSSRVSVEKARSAVEFKRPTKAFEDAIAQGRVQVLALSGAVPLEGGIPIVVDGKIIGAIGVSGATSQQDGVCANAGLAAIAPAAAAPAAPPAPAKK